MTTGKTKPPRLWHSLLLVLAALVLGVNLYLWNARQLVGNAMPMPFGCGVSVVMSGSMEPVLRVNDLVLIRETQQVQVGDIVVYQSGSSLIIHRVVQLEGDILVTQGDANNAPDAPITLADVKGVLWVTIPRVGVLVRLLKQPAVVLALLAAVLVLLELSFRREQEQDHADLEQLRAQIRQLKAQQTIREEEGTGE